LNKVLLTGSEGFIGRSLIASGLIDIKYRVDTRDGFLSLSSTEGTDSRHKFEITELHKHLPRDVSHILHFGAITSTTSTNEERFALFNTSMTNSLVDFSCNKGVNLIFASSASIYANQPTMNENLSLPTPSNLYAKSKWNSERYISLRCECKDSHITVLRLFNIFGKLEERKGSMSSIIWRFINDAIKHRTIVIFEREGHPLGSQSRDFVFVEDLIRFVDILIKKNAGIGTLNFGTGFSHTFNEIAELVASKFTGLEIKSTELPSEFSTNYQWYTKAETFNFRQKYPDFVFTPFATALQDIYEYCLGRQN
jgi:ADP-L-glycero-D-manno-heptose 6-epimerase